MRKMILSTAVSATLTGCSLNDHAMSGARGNTKRLESSDGDNMTSIGDGSDGHLTGGGKVPDGNFGDVTEKNDRQGGGD